MITIAYHISYHKGLSFNIKNTVSDGTQNRNNILRRASNHRFLLFTNISAYTPYHHPSSCRQKNLDEFAPQSVGNVLTVPKFSHDMWAE